MIALVMCLMMKIFECSSRRKCGRGSPIRCECKAGRRRRSGPRPSRPRGGGQTLSACAARKLPPGGDPALPPPPAPPTPPAQAEQLSNNNDADFTHENSDYQWFLDYNYRDSSCQHASVLSSVSSSYRGLDCYEELARDLDANLAEADMESFRTRDIHALLSQLPGHLMQDTNRRGEMYASVTSSLMEKFCFDSSFSPHSSSQGEESTAGSLNSMSLCKSELLFSPVREGGEPPAHFSVDSLDCEGLDSDIILTCRANKHNYTIAFQGSTTMYSEDSDCPEPANEKHELEGKRPPHLDSASASLHRSFRLSRPSHVSMANSDTTWSKLRSKSQLKRHPSGNNNTQECSTDNGGPLRSASAPDLRNDTSNETGTQEELYASENRLNIPIDYIKAYNNQNTNQSIGSQASEGMSSSGDSRGANNNSRPHNFNLVKLFMKQKSMSNDGIVGLGMDNSSECWPNSSEGGDSGDSFSAESKPPRPRIVTKMNLSSDKDYQSDEYDVPPADNKSNIKKWIDNESEEYSGCVFEDSLVEGSNAAEAYSRRTHDFIIEEDELSEKSEIVSDHDSDKNIYATVNKVAQMRFNVNNNNSFEKLGQNTGSPIRIRGNATTQTRKSISSSINSGSLSSCSESEGTQVTRMHRLLPKDLFDHKATSTQFPLDLIDKSMQTSTFNSRERVKVVEKSFLEKLKSGDSQKPVFVLYPNYTLPNLDFISKDQDMEKVFLKPLKFTPNVNKPNRRMQKQGEKNKRPFSCNDVEGLRKKGFNHIRDWDSLTFLLPMEYRQILAEMPEVLQKLKDKEDEILRHEEKPLFCVSPPVRHKTRPVSCDCASMLSNNATNVSSSSSTATQPSSGYRGSSTMLTDSSAQNSPAPAPGFNPLFVYKYDSATSSEASFMNEKHRMGAPPLPKRSISLAEQTKVAINGKVIDVAPPRPPLPKSILRKSIDKVRKNPPTTTKRYSMFEMEDHMRDNVTCMNVQTDQKVLKRRSLQEPYYLLKNNSIVEMKKNNDLAAKRFSQQFLDAAEKDMDDTEFFHDEGVGTESSLESGKSHDINGMRPPTPPLPKNHSKIPETSPYVFPTSTNYPVITSSELQQLEEFLKHSGISCNNMEEWDNNHMQKVRNQVSRFLCMKKSLDDRESLDSSCSSGHSKKSVSFAEKNENKKSGEGGLKPVEDLKAGNLSTPPNSPNISAATAHRHYQTKNLAEIPICEEGESSPEGYASPTLGHRPASNDISQKRVLVSGVVDAVEMLIEDGTGCPRVVIGMLCPALYSLMSDGLRETIDTSFGPANNSVWHVIEASARQGPITKSLNELVMRINSEDALSESVLKFNAFVMGLLNVHSLDAFISYLRTRESVLRRHYKSGALLRGGGGIVGSAPGGVAGPLAPLTAALASLSERPFALDILWQLRDMHRSFKRMEDLMANQSTSSSEWTEDRNGGKFRRLQRRWELLSGQEGLPGSPTPPAQSSTTPGSAGSTPGSAGSSTSSRSRIPRPVTSPVRPTSGPTMSPVKRSIPVPVSSAKKAVTPPSGGLTNQKNPLPPLPHATSTPTKVSNAGGVIKKTTTITNRVSRVEGCFSGGPPAPRPSSLPYRRAPPPSPSPAGRVPSRRAASSGRQQPPKMVRTLWHRLPSDSGHLAFNEGERLRLVLEVDQQWLLCCRGQQKGLVPRSAVIPVPDTVLQRF